MQGTPAGKIEKRKGKERKGKERKMIAKLADVVRASAATNLPPRIVVLGESGVGKTTYASKFPAPIFLDIESGTGSLDVPVLPIRTMTDFRWALNALRNESHEYKTVVIDSIDWLDEMLAKSISEANRVSNLAAIEYGKGYAELFEEWKIVISGIEELRAKGMIVVLISHAMPETVRRPDIPEYQRMGLALKRENVRDKLAAWVDVVVYIAKKRDKSRVYSVESTPTYVAKCRYTNIPPACVAEPVEFLAAIGQKKEKVDSENSEKAIVVAS